MGNVILSREDGEGSQVTQLEILRFAQDDVETNHGKPHLIINISRPYAEGRMSCLSRHGLGAVDHSLLQRRPGVGDTVLVVLRQRHQSHDAHTTDNGQLMNSKTEAQIGKL
jgi:hypothetical protein